MAGAGTEFPLFSCKILSEGIEKVYSAPAHPHSSAEKACRALYAILYLRSEIPFAEMQKKDENKEKEKRGRMIGNA